MKKVYSFLLSLVIVFFVTACNSTNTYPEHTLERNEKEIAKNVELLENHLKENGMITFAQISNYRSGAMTTNVIDFNEKVDDIDLVMLDAFVNRSNPMEDSIMVTVDLDSESRYSKVNVAVFTADAIALLSGTIDKNSYCESNTKIYDIEISYTGDEDITDEFREAFESTAKGLVWDNIQLSQQTLDDKGIGISLNDLGFLSL